MSNVTYRHGIAGSLLAITVLFSQLVAVSASAPAAAASPTVEHGAFIGSVVISEAQLRAAGLESAPVSGGTGGVVIQALCVINCVHVRDVAFWYEGQVYETQATGNNTTGSPATLTISKSIAVANNWSASVKVSDGVVTAAVGFSVTSSVSVKYQYSQTVPAHTCIKVMAYELFKVYKFNVYNEPFIGRDTLIGNGWAQNRDGERFDAYYC